MTLHTELATLGGKVYVTYHNPLATPAWLEVKRYGVLSPPYLEADELAAGQPWNLRLATGRADQAVLAVTTQLLSPPLNIPGLGSVWIDGRTLVGAVSLSVPASGTRALAVPTPTSPPLTGVTVYVQAAFAARPGTFRTTPPAATTFR